MQITSKKFDFLFFSKVSLFFPPNCDWLEYRGAPGWPDVAHQRSRAVIARYGRSSTEGSCLQRCGGFLFCELFFSFPWSVFVCVLKSGLHDHIQVCDSPIFPIDTFLKKVGIQCISSSLIWDWCKTAFYLRIWSKS